MAASRGPAPTLGGPMESFSAERASATPGAPPPKRARRLRAARDARPPKAARAPTVAQDGRVLPLAELQRWFLDVIAHPGTVEDGLAAASKAHPHVPGQVEGVLSSASNLGPVDRLGVYHYAYRERLRECLADDFPTVQHALGQDRFRQLCADVIREFPSSTPNLNGYGAVLPRWCQGAKRGLAHRGFISELATLEWAMVEVFHAEPAPTLSLAQLQQVPMEQWAGMRFAPSPSLRLLRFRHPVNAYLQAVREDRSPAIPRAKASWTAVYRVDFRIWRMDLTAMTTALLDSLLAGEALGPALERLAATPGVPVEELGASVMRWFKEWVAGGFFSPRLG